MSAAIKMEVVCPNDTNPMGILQGGKMVQWMDLTSAICAQNHAGCISVTASIDSVSFKTSAQIGDIITIESRVTRSFNTSMEIRTLAWKKNINMKERILINEAYFTFVAISIDGRPLRVADLKPQTAEEKRLYADAGKRKNKRIKI